MDTTDIVGLVILIYAVGAGFGYYSAKILFGL